MQAQIKTKRQADKLKARGFLALDAACAAIKTSWSINISCGYYGKKITGCTVKIGTKSFSKRGNDCIEESMKAAMTYLINTYSIFESIKKQNAV